MGYLTINMIFGCVKAGNYITPPTPGGFHGENDDQSLDSIGHWIGLRENLQETMVFTIKYRAFL
jgi:hypothetical protein